MSYMTKAERKREAARQHNAKLDWPKVEPLFVWLESLAGKSYVAPVREVRSGSRPYTKQHAMLMALAAMSAPPIAIHSGHESIARKGHNRRKW